MDIPNWLMKEFKASKAHENGENSLNDENTRKNAYWNEFSPNYEVLQEGNADRNRLNYCDKSVKSIFTNGSDYK